MSKEEVKNSELADEFSIFDTQVEDMVSYEEKEQYERKDYSKIYFEPDPKKAGKELIFLIKFCMNIYNPKDNIPKRYTYKIPVPERPEKNFTWVSPSTIGEPCPVMQFWLDNRESNDSRLKGLAESLKRKRYRAGVIQIISAPSNPELAGQFRLFKFAEGREIDNMINKKTTVTEEEKEMGLKGVNIYDSFDGPIMILRVKQGEYGRDFTGSSWAEADKNHGIILCDYDETTGIAIDFKQKGRVLHAADKDNMEFKKRIIELLKQEHISLKENWMFKEPDADYQAKCDKSLELMKNGSISSITRTSESDDQEETDETKKSESKSEGKSSEKMNDKVDESKESEKETNEKPSTETVNSKIDKAVDELFS